MSERRTVPITAVVTAFRRIEQTLATIERLENCDPTPGEILVHVDGGETACACAIRERFPHVGLIVSAENLGPGGGRNKLIEAATNPLVASFDDDSYPLDSDYFERLAQLFARQRDAALIASYVIDKGRPILEAVPAIAPTVDFVGCGVTYRRDSFLATGGYVPVPIAYGVEEVDLCIRMLDRGAKMYYSPWLRVFHDNDLQNHATAPITAASLANLALLAYLRYPVRYLPFGAIQVLHRLAWLLRVGRLAGTWDGLFDIPRHLWRHRQLRSPVSPGTIATFIARRRQPPAVVPMERESP